MRKMNKTNKMKKMKKMKGGAMLGSMAGSAMSGAVDSIIKTVAREIIALATEIGQIGINNTKQSIDMNNQSAKELIDTAKKAAIDIITHSKSTIQSAVPMPNASPAITPSTSPDPKQIGGKHKSHKSKFKFRKTTNRNRTKHSLNKKH